MIRRVTIYVFVYIYFTINPLLSGVWDLFFCTEKGVPHYLFSATTPFFILALIFNLSIIILLTTFKYYYKY